MRWQLPESVYAPYLKKLQPLFLSPYLLTPQMGHIRVPLPTNPQSQWSALIPGTQNIGEEVFEYPTIDKSGLYYSWENLVLPTGNRQVLLSQLIKFKLLRPVLSKRLCFQDSSWIHSEVPDAIRIKALREALIHQCTTLGVLRPLSSWHFELMLTKVEAQKALSGLLLPFDQNWKDQIVNHLYPNDDLPTASYRLYLDKKWEADEAATIKNLIPDLAVQSEDVPVQGGGDMQKVVRLLKALKKNMKQLVVKPDLNAQYTGLKIQDSYFTLNYQD